ncbi:hypothetical protein VUR80DRAFT_941 [Thermomyces stellatus]
MRANMDPLDPVITDLDPKIAQIYAQASQIRDALRERVPRPEETETPQRRRTRELAREVLSMPDKLRALVEEGRHEEARRAWEMPRRLLLVWRERGLGGEDVARLLEEGDGIVEGRGGAASASGSSTTFYSCCKSTTLNGSLSTWLTNTSAPDIFPRNVFSNRPPSTSFKNLLSVLLWYVVTTIFPFCAAARASWWLISPVIHISAGDARRMSAPDPAQTATLDTSAVLTSAPGGSTTDR